MKRILFASAAVLALTAGASAADLTYEPAPAPIVVAPVFDWTGFYAGVHAGGGWGNYNATLNGGPDVLGSASGALGGAQIGYNYQINQFVIGAQTDLAYTGINAQNGTTVYGLPVEGSTPWLGSTTLRAGYAWDTWLFYAKGGLAYGETEGKLGGWSKSSWSTGWTVGGGVEKAFTKNVTGFLEYDYFDLSDVDFTTPVGNVSVGSPINVIKAGINYKF